MSFVGVDIKQTIQRAMESVGIMEVESQRISGRMSSYIISSRADTTSKKYINCFNRTVSNVLKIFAVFEVLCLNLQI